MIVPSALFVNCCETLCAFIYICRFACALYTMYSVQTFLYFHTIAFLLYIVRVHLAIQVDAPLVASHTMKQNENKNKNKKEN